MNDRIQELAYQAEELADAEVDSGSEFHPAFCRIFAELIVRDCAKFLEDNSGYDSANNSWHPEPDDLLNHFGVE